MTFTIYVMQSAHTDIGYTHPQEQIMDMYLDHYDLVLDLCRKTADAPIEHRFKWTCETFWQVQNYVQHRPERLDEFLSYVRTGQIEVTAAYLHFADLIDADAYRRSIAIAQKFRDEHNIPVRGALHCDINGWPWAVADILSEANVPFFCSQVHIDNATDPLGKRGSVHYQWLLENPSIRKDAPIRIPQVFWWEGPQGGRVLHWLSEHYMLGNVLGISSPQGFGADKTRYYFETDRLTSDDMYAMAQERVPAYIARLQAGGYAHDKLMISTGGYYTDNSRPDPRWCDVIARWNAEHTGSDAIVMRTTTLGEWYDALIAQGTDQLPVYRAAWPDAWAHGLGSSTARIAQARRTQRRRANVIGLVGQVDPKASKAAHNLDTALNYERFAVEHTFDAWSTTGRPEAPANEFQHIFKDLNFFRAELYLDESSNSALHTLLAAPDDKQPRLCVYSTTDGLHTVHFDAGDTQIDPHTHALSDSEGEVYPLQADFAPLHQYVAVLPTQANQLSVFNVIKYAESIAEPSSTPADSLNLKNSTFRLTIDAQTGGLDSLVKRRTNGEWVEVISSNKQGGATGGFAFGQLVHEAVVHPDGREAVGNTARLQQLGVLTDEASKRFRTDIPIVEHTTLKFAGSPQRITGPTYDAIQLAGSSERLGDAVITWRIYHALPMVELVIDWHKRWSDLPEAAYVTFPFSVTEQATLEFETGGGFFRPGSHEANGQIPGTDSTFYTIQNAARIHNGDQHLLWLPIDAPLVMTNALNYNRWETGPYAWNGFLASMPVNHYWHTNFPTSQRGFIRLRYRLISVPNGSEAAQLGALNAALPLDAAGWR